MKKLLPMLLAGAMAVSVCGAMFADDMDYNKSNKDSNTTMDQKMAKMQAKKLDKLTKDLALTPDQKSKVSDIMRSTGDQKKALITKMESDEKNLRDSEDAQIKAVLTADQQVKYDKMIMEHQAKMEKKAK
jgi:hypothetical protein